jgi:hypothetical protein
MKKGKLPKGFKLIVQGLPLAGAVVAMFLPLSRLGQQFLVLIALLWVQLFFIIEVFILGSR